jgi:D-xylose 1-dehydrogenase
LTAAHYPSLAGKRVYITGGATGIGAELVRSFATQKALVTFNDILPDAGFALVAELAGAAHVPTYETVDVTDVAALQSSVRGCATRLGGLDVLINNVANDTRHSPLEISADAWRRCMAVNLDSAFFAAQAALPVMQAQGGGAIINFSSINALLGPTDMPGYVAAKAGLLGLTKALAREFGKDRIRVNCILPGWVVTERQLDKWLTPEAEAKWSELVALKDRILPADVASLALFLAADDSRSITAQHFVIDAGRV